MSVRDVAYGSVYLTVQNILSTFIGVLGYSFLTRCVSQVDVGVVAGMMMLSSLLQLLSDLGFSSSIVKFVSEFRGRGEDASGFFISALFIRLPLSILFSILLFLFPDSLSLALFKTESYSSPIRLLAIDVLLISNLPLLSGTLLGAGRLREIAYYGVISVLVRWLMIVALLLCGFGVGGVVLGWIAGDSLALTLYSTCLIKSGIIVNSSVRRVAASRLLRFSFPLYVASLISFLYSYYDRAIVLAFLPLSDLGLYDVAYKAYSVLISFSASASTALFPYYGMAYGRNYHELISLAMRRASKYSALVFSPLALGLFATSRPLITLFAGEPYEGGYTVLSILSLFALVYSLSPAFSNLLLIYGKTRIILLLSLVPIAVSLSSLPLLWYLGLNGLAIMRGLATLLSFALSMFALSRVVRISLDSVALLKIFSCSAIMSLAVLSMEHLYYSSLLLPLYVAFGGVVYTISLKLSKALSDDDIIFLEQILGEKIGSFMRRIIHP